MSAKEKPVFKPPVRRSLSPFTKTLMMIGLILIGFGLASPFLMAWFMTESFGGLAQDGDPSKVASNMGAAIQTTALGLVSGAVGCILLVLSVVRHRHERPAKPVDGVA